MLYIAQMNEAAKEEYYEKSGAQGSITLMVLPGFS